MSVVKAVSSTGWVTKARTGRICGVWFWGGADGSAFPTAGAGGVAGDGAGCTEFAASADTFGVAARAGLTAALTCGNAVAKLGALSKLLGETGRHLAVANCVKPQKTSATNATPLLHLRKELVFLITVLHEFVYPATNPGHKPLVRERHAPKTSHGYRMSPILLHCFFA
ncbi:MAG TPA: hypothetical protein VKR82_06855 [Candidatus Acidoferrales bacterium]|nr:hypothetical protein [Candidatus Acidoferrales bacterium]